MDAEEFSKKDVEDYLKYIKLKDWEAIWLGDWETKRKFIRHLSALQKHNVLKYFAVMDYFVKLNEGEDTLTTNRLFKLIASLIYTEIEQGRENYLRMKFKHPKTGVVRYISSFRDILGTHIFWDEPSKKNWRWDISFPKIKPTVISWMKEGFQFNAGENTFVSACISCPDGAMNAICSGCYVSVYCGEDCQKKDWSKHKCTK